jgi:hypothetical protein
MSECLSLTNLTPGFEFILTSVLCALRPRGNARLDEIQRSLATDTFLAIGPRDALEAIWAGQAVAMSHAALAAWEEMGRTEDDPDLADRLRRTAVMLTKAGAQMVRLIQSRRRQNARDAAPAQEGSRTSGTRQSANPAAPAGGPQRASEPPAAASRPPSRPRSAEPAPARHPARPAPALPPVRPATPAPAIRMPEPVRSPLIPGLPDRPGLPAALATAAAALSRSGLLSSVAHTVLPEPVA